MRFRDQNWLSGGVFGQPVARKPHSDEWLLNKSNQAKLGPKNAVFRRLLAISHQFRQTSSSFFRDIEANWRQPCFCS